jgi:alkanesulfonate monooxygenase SsuD/methylene tetrahydromethanopterin reductase-like flavin-dependent oxidoreductase (luciferase family)
MPDYGHELMFGTFVTPQNQRPHEVVALAELSERVGLDLVTFQDHPYQPALLDAWTLLSWVAARTELLSGGRVELGLGAGAFWPAITAMGGPGRAPREAVEAVAEAIEIIRAIWNPDAPDGIRITGEHYTVSGAKRGPKPAHNISIWLGAVKPGMLRLIGEKADGWLPSLTYVQDGDLEQGNAIIDDAAAGAGREPREIRRLLNISGAFTATNRGLLKGPSSQWVSELVPFVRNHGVSTFILASDDPHAIQVWGEEVGPKLREEVNRERWGGSRVSGGRRSSDRAL